jgi:hypothetical protein
MKVYYTILFLLLTVSGNVSGAGGELYMYLPYSLYIPRKLETKLQSEYKGIEIKVFIKKRDLLYQMQEKEPGAILANSLLIEDIKDEGYIDYEIKLIGTKKGKTDEPYTIIVNNSGSSVNFTNKYKVDSLFPSTIAIPLITEEDRMKELVHGFIEPKTVQFEKFAKLEDLLNYYTQAAIIPERLIPYFTMKYKKNVIFYKLPKFRMNICVLAIRVDENEYYYIKYVNKLSQEIMEIIGVDQWEEK